MPSKEIIELSMYMSAGLVGIEDNTQRENVSKYVLRWLESVDREKMKTLTKEDYGMLRTSVKKFTMSSEAKELIKKVLKLWVEDIEEVVEDGTTNTSGTS